MLENTVTSDDMRRLETKIDKLGDAVGKLVLVEERQANQTARLDKHEEALVKAQESVVRLHARIDKYTYLATGAAFVVMGAFELARIVFVKGG
jgi:hypothetical protein